MEVKTLINLSYAIEVLCSDVDLLRKRIAMNYDDEDHEKLTVLLEAIRVLSNTNIQK